MPPIRRPSHSAPAALSSSIPYPQRVGMKSPGPFLAGASIRTREGAAFVEAFRYLEVFANQYKPLLKANHKWKGADIMWLPDDDGDEDEDDGDEDEDSDGPPRKKETIKTRQERAELTRFGVLLTCVFKLKEWEGLVGLVGGEPSGTMDVRIGATRLGDERAYGDRIDVNDEDHVALMAKTLPHMTPEERETLRKTSPQKMAQDLKEVKAHFSAALLEFEQKDNLMVVSEGYVRRLELENDLYRRHLDQYEEDRAQQLIDGVFSTLHEAEDDVREAERARLKEPGEELVEQEDGEFVDMDEPLKLRELRALAKTMGYNLISDEDVSRLQDRARQSGLKIEKYPAPKVDPIGKHSLAWQKLLIKRGLAADPESSGIGRALDDLMVRQNKRAEAADASEDTHPDLSYPGGDGSSSKADKEKSRTWKKAKWGYQTHGRGQKGKKRDADSTKMASNIDSPIVIDDSDDDDKADGPSAEAAADQGGPMDVD
ncbi:MAG: hypothetical protein M1819_004867 [Sarea resinae]|nr:MAG: hypothetical protein M1819_004867 [Sarea resinae]